MCETPACQRLTYLESEVKRLNGLAIQAATTNRDIGRGALDLATTQNAVNDEQCSLNDTVLTSLDIACQRAERVEGRITIIEKAQTLVNKAQAIVNREVRTRLDASRGLLKRVEQRVTDVEKAQKIPSTTYVGSTVGVDLASEEPVVEDCTMTSYDLPKSSDTDVVRHFLGRHRRCFGNVGARESCDACEKKYHDKINSLVDFRDDMKDGLKLLHRSMTMNLFTPVTFCRSLQKAIEELTDLDDVVEELKPR